jgi:hypothetical protein
VIFATPATVSRIAWFERHPIWIGNQLGQLPDGSYGPVDVYQDVYFAIIRTDNIPPPAPIAPAPQAPAPFVPAAAPSADPVPAAASASTSSSSSTTSILPINLSDWGSDTEVENKEEENLEALPAAAKALIVPVEKQDPAIAYQKFHKNFVKKGDERTIPYRNFQNYMSVYKDVQADVAIGKKHLSLKEISQLEINHNHPSARDAMLHSPPPELFDYLDQLPVITRVYTDKNTLKDYAGALIPCSIRTLPSCPGGKNYEIEDGVLEIGMLFHNGKPIHVFARPCDNKNEGFWKHNYGDKKEQIDQVKYKKDFPTIAVAQQIWIARSERRVSQDRRVIEDPLSIRIWSRFGVEWVFYKKR